MKKKLKLFGMGSASIVIAALILLTAFTPILSAEQRLEKEQGLLLIEGISITDEGLIDKQSIDKDCPCIERTAVICDYLVPGIAAIQSDPDYFDQGLVGSGELDTAPVDYEERLEAVSLYCEDGTLPGSWYGAATGYGGIVEFANPIMVCFTLGLISIGIGYVISNIILVGISIGMSIIDAMLAAGITVWDMIDLAMDFMTECVAALG